MPPRSDEGASPRAEPAASANPALTASAEALERSAHVEEPPQALGPFVLQKKLGEGGQGSVYRAVQVKLDRVVALKVLSSWLGADRAYTGRFHTEARLAARLRHRNIVSVYDSGESHGWHWLAFELVDGPNVAQVLARDGPFAEERALQIALDVANAMVAALEVGILHRDIKPANVLLASDGTAKLADLGMARDDRDLESHMTAPGVVMGTPLYMSPEQVVGDVIDVRSDIYALGLMLVQMLTGHLPLAGASAVETMMRHRDEDVPLPSALREDVSRRTDLIARVMTERDSQRRYQDPTSLAKDLEAVLKGKPPAHAARQSLALDDPSDTSQGASAEFVAPDIPPVPTQLAAVESGSAETVAPAVFTDRRRSSSQNVRAARRPYTRQRISEGAVRTYRSPGQKAALLALSFVVVAIFGTVVGVLLTRSSSAPAPRSIANEDSGIADRLRRRQLVEKPSIVTPPSVAPEPEPEPTEGDPPAEGTTPTGDGEDEGEGGGAGEGETGAPRGEAPPLTREAIEAAQTELRDLARRRNFVGCLARYRELGVGADLERLQEALIEVSDPEVRRDILGWAAVDRAAAGERAAAEHALGARDAADDEIDPGDDPQRQQGKAWLRNANRQTVEGILETIETAIAGDPARARELLRPIRDPMREWRRSLILGMLGPAAARSLTALVEARAFPGVVVRGAPDQALRDVGAEHARTLLAEPDALGRLGAPWIDGGRAALGGVRPELAERLRGAFDRAQAAIDRVAALGRVELDLTDPVSAWTLDAQPGPQWRPDVEGLRLDTTRAPEALEDLWKNGMVRLELHGAGRFARVDLEVKGPPGPTLAFAVLSETEEDTAARHAIVDSFDAAVADGPLPASFLDEAWSLHGSGHTASGSRPFTVSLVARGEGDERRLVVLLGDDEQGEPLATGEAVDTARIGVYLTPSAVLVAARIEGPSARLDPEEQADQDRARTRHELRYALGSEAERPQGVAVTTGGTHEEEAHLRFGGDGAWLELRFEAEQPGDQLAVLRLEHLASMVGERAGFAPIAIELNGQNVEYGFEPSPNRRFGWDRFEITGQVTAGENVLRVELGPGSTSQYWLKTVELRY